MAWLSRLSAVAALATTALAAEASTSSAKTPAAEPCAQIAALVKKDVNRFSSELGLACLESLPFKSDLAVSFVDDYTKYLQWQSTSEILRDPPKGSVSSTIDLFGGMANIRDRASANLYKSQYDFDLDLTHLIGFANDGHLALTPCSFGAIAWLSPLSLVSLSTDGVAIPKLYTLSDGELLAAGNTDVSPVILINGVGAEVYIEELSENVGLQDADARYNSMLANVPIGRDGSENDGGFSFFQSFPGVHEFNVTYGNGTLASYPLSTGILTALGGFTFQTGEALWDAICDPASAKPSKKRSVEDIVKNIKRRDEAAQEKAAPETYPKPVVKDPFNLLIGYFPDDTELKDVAVLTVPTFSTAGDGLPDDQVKNFALEAQDFVKRALAAGKSRIIIDVTNNGGGVVDSGFGLVSVFFPNMTIFSATRFRSVPATQFIVETVSRVKNPSDNLLLTQFGFFVPELVQPDQKTTFKTTEEFLGPFETFGVPSTAIVAANDFDETDPNSAPINIFGLGGGLNETAPPFKPENIVILTDGQCSSTCTIFINHMIPYGVRVFAAGGRAQNGPMQGIGGVKGSQVLELENISQLYDEANELVQNATDAKKPLFTEKEYSVFSAAIPPPLDKLPFRVSSGSVNFRNAFAPFNDQVPTHFIYQPADCRLFYTAEMLGKPELLWVNAAKAAWHNGACAFSVAPTKPIKSDDDATPSSGSVKSDPTTTAAPQPTSTHSSDDTPAASSDTSSSKKKTLSPAHKALGLLLAMAEGLRPQD
ncbi:hypothetical protein N5P37_005546 [Trichoderma harzianum]|uniref:Uncharacterized protein n=1 Tax=Trichoderma harzianum CBS 226.95 TaxID=983964 RepID=A0A2T4ABK6_TRIHA|nr:hypothetical protein M431DRAFT_115039 [Trichoderma harzianum CBS 226.95]KAK0762728.1 hypothetical protein N5P37_005546 [Trichoderma harzianum]PKK54464.1 hypothetical protein CI102_920 [Trichoderma harzianum]PTB54455.1 hypothetical protein M431DRAFT_115039 [Trichoderma harzianum CBS 226.95]